MARSGRGAGQRAIALGNAARQISENNEKSAMVTRSGIEINQRCAARLRRGTARLPSCVAASWLSNITPRGGTIFSRRAPWRVSNAMPRAGARRSTIACAKRLCALLRSCIFAQRSRILPRLRLSLTRKLAQRCLLCVARIQTRSAALWHRCALPRCAAWRK